ncbi:MAG: hypothetical protein R3B07_07620 [Polyangiaceae bacterium]
MKKMRQIDKQNRLRSGLVLAVGVTVIAWTGQALAAPNDAGASEATQQDRIGDHALFIDADGLLAGQADKLHGAEEFDTKWFVLDSAPRLSANAIVLGGLTLGGAVSYLRVARDDYQYTDTSVAPRVGYLIGLGDSFAIWPNVQVGYGRGTQRSNEYDYAAGGGNRSVEHVFQSWRAVADLRLVAKVVDHFGVTAGLGYTNQFAEKSDSGPWDPGRQAISADLGLAAWF